MSNRPWSCPFCNQNAVFREDDERHTPIEFVHPLTSVLKDRKAVVVHLEFCPNQECKKTALTVELWSMQRLPRSTEWTFEERKCEWKLLPESTAKEFPDFIPAAILSDYREACRIASLSAKASATLARRCLQGMIRDFWGITKKTTQG